LCQHNRGSGALGYLGQLSKRRRIANREIRKKLPIDFYAGPLEASHELTVRKIMKPSGSIDPHNPQPPEITLLLATIAVGVSQTAFNVFFGGLVQLAPTTDAAFGGFHDFLFALEARNTISHSWHCTPPYARIMRRIRLVSSGDTRVA
jgi:hypothetical protein